MLKNQQKRLSCVVSRKYFYLYNLKPNPMTTFYSCVPFLLAYRRLNAVCLMEMGGLGTMELGGIGEISGRGGDIRMLSEIVADCSYNRLL